jgi:stress response protein YsnF
MQKTHVLQAARAVWHLARVNREFDKSQQQLYKDQPNMRQWNAVQQAEFERMLRYRTRAERAHARAWQAVEFLRKLRLQAKQYEFWVKLNEERLDLSKQRLELSAERLRQSIARSEKAHNEKLQKETVLQEKVTQEKAKPQPIAWHAPVVHLSQVIEVRLVDGIISHRVYPDAADLQQRADRAAAGTGVLRRFEFPEGIPAEYAWVNEPDMARNGVIWEQFFDTIEAWRAHVACETAAGLNRYLSKRRVE